MSETKSPNILLISTDQQRADHLGCYGNKILKTPSIDFLAENGTRFDRCYVASPVCMPNRASLVTGRMPSLHGLRHNGLDLPWATVTFADVLVSAGWTTSLIGKAHFQCMTDNPSLMARGSPIVENSLLPYAEARKSDGEFYGQESRDKWCKDPKHDLIYPYYGFQSVRLATEHGDEVGGHYGRWLANKHSKVDKIRGLKNALTGKDRSAPQAWRTAIPEELYSTRYIENETIRTIKENSNNGTDPFFIWCSFCDPHHPFTPPGKYWDLYSPADIDLPKSFYAQQSDHNSAQGFISRIRSERATGRANLNGTSTIAVTENEARDAIALTYGSIAMIDDAIGRIIQALENEELLENTIVIFTSDHGDFMGDHGLLFKGPIHLQSLIRVPLIWMDGRKKKKNSSQVLCSTIDISKSILEASGVGGFNGMQGQDLFDRSGKNTIFEREFLLIEDEVQYCLPQTNTRGRARTLVSDRWRLTIYDGISEGQLVDLEEDPLELRNLWDEPNYTSTRIELVEQMTRKMIELSESSPLPRFAA